MYSFCLCACMLSHVWLSATLWAIACQAPLSMEFSREECWSGLPFPPPGELPDPGIEPVSPASAAASLPLSHLESPSSYHTVLISFMTSKLALVFHFNSYLPRPKNFIFQLSFCEQKISSWFLSSWPFSPRPCLNFHFIIWISLFRRNETFSSFGSRYSKKKCLHSFGKDLAYLFTYLSQEMLVIMYPKTELRWMEMQKKKKKTQLCLLFLTKFLKLRSFAGMLVCLCVEGRVVGRKKSSCSGII